MSHSFVDITYYGKFTPDCDVIAAGSIVGGFELEEILDVDAETPREAKRIIQAWADQYVGLFELEIVFDSF